MPLACTCRSCDSNDLTVRASRIKISDLGALFVNEGKRERETSEDARGEDGAAAHTPGGAREESPRASASRSY